MPVDPSADVTAETLRAKTLTDLIESVDEHDEAYVEAYLEEALEATATFLADHDKRVPDLPAVTFDPALSGVDYDPYHRDGEMLVFGGPRGILQGGYQFLSHRDHLSKPSLLTILSKGLLHAYNHSLVRERFERHGRAARLDGTPSVRLYDEYKMLVPAVDEGITQMFGLYIEGDVTDRSLREGFVDAWASWYREADAMDVALFEAVARTISDRIEAADGDPRDRIVDGLAIQEPLVGGAELSVLGDHLADASAR